MQLNLLHCLLLTDEYQMQKIDFCHVAKKKIVFSIVKNSSKNLEELPIQYCQLDSLPLFFILS